MRTAVACAVTGLFVSMLGAPPPAGAQTLPPPVYCENPPLDEPDNDGDECWEPPHPPKNRGCRPEPSFPALPPEYVLPEFTGASDRPGLYCGNPINGATGNKVQVERDYLGGGPFPLDLTRVYNSSARNELGPFGAGWASGLHVRLLRVSATQVDLARGDGRVFRFTESAGSWTSDADVELRLTAQMAGGSLSGWLVRTEADGTESYDTGGRLLSRSTRAGVQQRLAYDAQGRLASVSDAFGRSLSLSYGADGRVSAVTLPGGLLVRYAYDPLGNLATVTFPDGRLKRYEYLDARHPHALTGLVDEAGIRFASWTYDAEGRAISSQRAGGVEKVTLAFDPQGWVTETDALGNTRMIVYQVSSGVARPVYVNTANTTRAAFHDSRGNLVAFDTGPRLPAMTLMPWRATFAVEYEPVRNLPTRITNRTLGQTIAIEWHPMWRSPATLHRTDESGRLVLGTTLVYDTAGNLVERTDRDASDIPRTQRWTFNANGQPTSGTDATGAITRFAYDTQGNLASVTNVLGHVERYESNVHGRVTRSTDANGVVTTYVYDSRQRLTSFSVNGETTRFTLDAIGQVSRVDRPDGTYATYARDSARRLTDFVESSGSGQSISNDRMSNPIFRRTFSGTSAGVNAMEWKSFDPEGRVVSTTLNAVP